MGGTASKTGCPPCRCEDDKITLNRGPGAEYPGAKLPPGETLPDDYYEEPTQGGGRRKVRRRAHKKSRKSRRTRKHRKQ